MGVCGGLSTGLFPLRGVGVGVHVGEAVLDSCCCDRLAAQDLRDRTYYLSNGVIRVGGRRVATNAANFQKGDTVGCVLDADQVGAGGDETASWGQQDRRSGIPREQLAGLHPALC